MIQEHYSSLVKVDNIYSATFKFFSKTFSIANMSVKALDAHTKVENHKQRQPCKDARNRVTSQLVGKDSSQVVIKKSSHLEARTQPAFICKKLIVETLEKSVKYVQS